MSAPTTITIRAPSKYSSSTTPASPQSPPPLEWLHRTWSVTHSTLSMWRSARNVRITYKPLPAHHSISYLPRLDDLVEYESLSGKGSVKTVAGIDTASSASSSAWDWRGKGWLMIASSHWEVLGWGERPREGGDGTERWAVTWFAPTLFTKEGIDIYSDRKEGLSEETLGEIMAALKGCGIKAVEEMCNRDMRAIEIALPWKER
ncbi:hypothetical protein DL546_006027 [Coniochaeta pulveracea]|uniref:Uncharacterized protein n=1 Tax=Coniochaeta pulveracea TaxID=177199 RepID=A0A420YGH0_9PEZI|nr:hypothetical protein DL546_006027 [Coniochaeta pulveracea]